MAFDRVLQRLSSDDVLPAEGVQDVVDTANGNNAALYVQHDEGFARHLEYGPFIVARALVKIDATLGPADFRVITSAGYLSKVSWETTPYPNIDARLVFQLWQGYQPTGASVCVRFTEGTIDLTSLAPLTYVAGDREIAVQFDGSSAIYKNSYVHVLIRGVRA